MRTNILIYAFFVVAIKASPVDHWKSVVRYHTDHFQNFISSRIHRHVNDGVFPDSDDLVKELIPDFEQSYAVEHFVRWRSIPKEHFEEVALPEFKIAFELLKEDFGDEYENFNFPTLKDFLAEYPAVDIWRELREMKSLPVLK